MIINIELSDKVLDKLEKRAETNKRSRKAEAEVIIEETLK